MEELQNSSQEQAALLLTLLLYGGEDDLCLLSYLPTTQRDQLTLIGRSICETPRRDILPHIVRELKRLTMIPRFPFAQFSVQQLSTFLAHEAPRVISAILRPFPRSFREKVLQMLPERTRQNIPLEQRELHPEIVQLFHKHPVPPAKSQNEEGD